MRNLSVFVEISVAISEKLWQYRHCLCRVVCHRVATEHRGRAFSAEPVKVAVSAEIEARSEETAPIFISVDAPAPEAVPATAHPIAIINIGKAAAFRVFQWAVASLVQASDDGGQHGAGHVRIRREDIFFHTDDNFALANKINV